MINNIYNYNSLSYNINNTTRFSPNQNSLRLNDTSNTISFASLNVRGINDICKFDDILDDLIIENFSVIGLQKTRLKETNANFIFKNFINSQHPDNHYKDYWSFDPHNSAGRVGFVIAPFVSKYVQKIHRFHSRFIALDLFLPAKKLKIINIYNFQQGDFLRSGKSFAKFVSQQLKMPAKKISKSSSWATLIAMFHYILMPLLKVAPHRHILASSN